MEIFGKRIKLRAIEKRDLTFLKDLFNHPEIEATTVGTNLPVSVLQQERWYENSMSNQQEWRFVIEKTGEEKAVGLYTVYGIDRQNSVISVSYKISPEEQRKGYATDAQRAFFRYAFRELNIYRISEEVLDYNTASQRVAEKSGMKLEGRLREAVYKHGKRRDLLLYGVLKSEYMTGLEETDEI